MYSDSDLSDSNHLPNREDLKYNFPSKNLYKPISQLNISTLNELLHIANIDPKSQYSLARAFEELVSSGYDQLNDDPEQFYKLIQDFKEAASIRVHFRDLTRSRAIDQGISEDISFKLIPKSYIPPKYSLTHQIAKDEKSNPSKKIRKNNHHSPQLDKGSPNGFASTPNTVASKSTYASVAVSSVPIQSFKITKNTKTHTYKPFFAHNSSKSLLAELEYPSGFSETFSLVVPYSRKEGAIDHEEYNPVQDIISTVELIAYYCCDSEIGIKYGDTKSGHIRNLIKSKNTGDQQLFTTTLNHINQLTRELRQNNEFANPNPLKNSQVSSHILHQAYSRAVAPHSDLLVENRAFSSTTYGEINPIFVNEIIEKTDLTEDMIFIDLGSGIGNVVLQVAAQVGCESHGVEIVPITHSLARLNRQELHHRYGVYNADAPKCWLHQGDLSSDPSIKLKIAEADVVLANNYLFDSRLDHKLSELLMNMKNGARVVSLKPLVPLDFKVNKRNLGELSAIMKCEKLSYAKDFVSWTNSSGDYYLQTIDRHPLEEYLSNQI